MRSAIWAALDAARVRVEKDGAVQFVPFKPGPGQVSAVVDALKGVTHQPADRMAVLLWRRYARARKAIGQLYVRRRDARASGR